MDQRRLLALEARAGADVVALGGHVGDAAGERLDLDGDLHLLFGALCEGAMVIARAKKPREALATVTREVDELLEGMRVQNPPR